MTTPGFTADAATSPARQTYLMASRGRGVGIEPAAKMSPQECYKRDSNCTQFCGRITDSKWRYECFSRCNIYLDNCLGRGVWTDRAATRF